MVLVPSSKLHGTWNIKEMFDQCTSFFFSFLNIKMSQCVYKEDYKRDINQFDGRFPAKAALATRWANRFSSLGIQTKDHCLWTTQCLMSTTTSEISQGTGPLPVTKSTKTEESLWKQQVEREVGIASGGAPAWWCWPKMREGDDE